MQIKEITSKLEERFESRDLERHFNKHTSKDGKSLDPNYPNDISFKYEDIPDMKTYDDRADAFVRIPITDPDMRGFVRDDGKYLKYNVKTQEFSVYAIENGKPINITYTPITREQWEKIKKRSVYSHSIDPKEDVK